MSQNNGVIRVGRKGTKKFAFGEDGEPFEVDVVSAFQKWTELDDSYREKSDDRSILMSDMQSYYNAAKNFVYMLSGDTIGTITIAEALEFLAKLKDEYSALTDFFRPRSRDEPDLPDSSGAELRFSEEAL